MNTILMKPLLCLILFLYNSVPLFSQHAHDESGGALDLSTNPPHHGHIQDVGKYYIEMTVDWVAVADKINIYLIKSNGKLVELNKNVSAVIQFADAENNFGEEVALFSSDNESYIAQLTEIDGFTCRITMWVKQKEYVADFVNISPDF